MRSAFDPMRVPKLLPHMSIYDFDEPGVIRIRLIGTKMVRDYPIDPTGGNYLDFVAPDRREAALQGFLVPAFHPCGMRVLGRNCHPGGFTTPIETIGFPFDSETGSRQMVFVGVEVKGSPFSDRPDRPGLERFEVIERQFFDIGAGMPE